MVEETAISQKGLQSYGLSPCQAITQWGGISSPSWELEV